MEKIDIHCHTSLRVIKDTIDVATILSEMQR